MPASAVGWQHGRAGSPASEKGWVSGAEVARREGWAEGAWHALLCRCSPLERQMGQWGERESEQASNWECACVYMWCVCVPVCAL